MARSINKGYSYGAPRDVLVALERLSKAALLDIVCDALEISGDGEDMTVSQAAEFCNPRLLIRGDRLIQAPGKPTP